MKPCGHQSIIAEREKELTKQNNEIDKLKEDIYKYEKGSISKELDSVM